MNNKLIIIKRKSMKEKIKNMKFLTVFIITAVICYGSIANAKLTENQESISAGKKVYTRHCWPCHGVDGGGDGPAAQILEPRPRNFISALFKLRTTTTGNLPVDEDLFKTITNGMPGSAMPAFKSLLKEDERWQVIYYIKTLSEYFADESLDPYKNTVTIGSEKAVTPASIDKGRVAYEKAECFKCHGENGKGNGDSAIELTDQEGYRLLPRNLTKGWKYRGGTSVTDIYTRFTTGMDGTPMPSFIDNLTDDERWDLATYVKSLIKNRDLTGSMLKGKKIEGDLTLDSESSLWVEAEPLEVALAGQIIWKPRWLIPSIETMVVQCIFNEEEIAFKLTYDDRFKDTEHDEATLLPISDTAYPILQSEDPEFDPHFTLNEYILRDSVAIQFPQNPVEGTEKPHFMWGYGNSPVYLLKWNSDIEEQGSNPVFEMNAKGHKKPPKEQPKDSQTAVGKGVFTDGQWSVVIKRKLVTEDKADTQFETGTFIPVSFQAWDGSNSENGSRMSLTTWNFLILEGSMPVSVYIYTAIFIVIAGLLEWLFTWRAKNSKN